MSIQIPPQAIGTHLSGRGESRKRNVYVAEGSEIPRKIQHTRDIMNAPGFFLTAFRSLQRGMLARGLT
jgi:hypothetical protein